ncbi:hypothetical protein OKW96_09990 [Sphingobacterium sp. KU25419]|nr:hypothetical protein OKW96_09990 [Sphingobacterium sp. KU25419]
MKSWFRYYDEPVMRLEFNKLGKTKQLDFLDDFGKASYDILQSFRKNPVLIRHWDECHESFVVYRKEIRFLNELHHFKVKDPNAFDHLAFFKNRPISGQAMSKFHATGGHTEKVVLNGVNSHFRTSNGVEILDPFYSHAIDPNSTSASMLNYINNSKDGTNIVTLLPDGTPKLYKYDRKVLASGHIEHRQPLF